MRAGKELEHRSPDGADSCEPTLTEAHSLALTLDVEEESILTLLKLMLRRSTRNQRNVHRA